MKEPIDVTWRCLHCGRDHSWPWDSIDVEAAFSPDQVLTCSGCKRSTPVRIRCIHLQSVADPDLFC